MQKITVRITQLPVESFSYFQWFLCGLYKLEDEDEIDLKIDIPLRDKSILFTFDNKYLTGGLRRLINKYQKVPRYNLRGTVEIAGGETKTFAIDSKDSPFIFTLEDLMSCDIYIKNQCPIDFDVDGFHIANGVVLPWQDVAFGPNPPEYSHVKRQVFNIIPYISKIHPGMIGPRRMGWTCKKKSLYNSYSQLTDIANANTKSRKKLAAYFGSALYPGRQSNLSKYDFDWESDLISFLGESHTHPNEKRSTAVDIINTLGSDYEGRLISDSNGVHHPERVIPLSEFSRYLSNFDYNLNISGFRLSIPNRFIESFAGGTAIVTDRLSVKWYLPFDEEVVETISMGYEKDIDVDWNRFRSDIANLPDVNPAKVRKSFFLKWAPGRFARYVISLALNSSSK